MKIDVEDRKVLLGVFFLQLDQIRHSDHATNCSRSSRNRSGSRVCRGTARDRETAPVRKSVPLRLTAFCPSSSFADRAGAAAASANAAVSSRATAPRVRRDVVLGKAIGTRLLRCQRSVDQRPEIGLADAPDVAPGDFPRGIDQVYHRRAGDLEGIGDGELLPLPRRARRG